MSALCPWPGCGRPIAADAVLCFEHHFRLPAKEARTLLRLKIEARRNPSADRRQHLAGQLPFYIRSAIKRAQAKEGQSAA